MSKRISVNERLNKEKSESPRDSLFRSTTETELKEETKEKIVSDAEVTRRQTYYLTEELINALIMYKAFEDKELSVIVREALYEYIPEEYLERAREKIKTI